jgi:hypothetical protein
VVYVTEASKPADEIEDRQLRLDFGEDEAEDVWFHQTSELTSWD